MRFSLVIVTYNGREYIDRCVKSIISSNIKNYEIIVVDNGSTDGTIPFLKESYGKNSFFKLIELDKNYGPAYARNKGVAAATGEYIGFLDNDTAVKPNWAVEAGNYFDKHPDVGIVQCKLLLLKEPNKIDYVGEYLGQNGFLVQETPAGTIDAGQFNTVHEILAAKSAGMFIRKKAFEEAGGFDDDYFIYVEETDLGWRTRLLGYKAIYLPTSIVHHEFGTSTLILGKTKNNYNAKFHGTKNYILTLSKNLSFKNLFFILPVHITLWLGLACYSFVKRDFSVGSWIFKGIYWNIKNFRNTIKKRSIVQSRRRITDDELFKVVMVKKPMSYFVNKTLKKQRVGNAEGFVKSS